MPRPKGSKNKRTIAKEAQIKQMQGIDPRAHIASVLANEINGPSATRTVNCPECGHTVEAPDHAAADRYRAAVDLMPYTYARLTAMKVDAKVDGEISVKHQTEAVRLIETAMDTIKPVNGHDADAS